MGFHYMNLARFAAIGTVVFAIHAKANTFLPLAVAAIAIARALPLRQIALATENRGSHILPLLRVQRPGLVSAQKTIEKL
jgi:hypothetical protein